MENKYTSPLFLKIFNSVKDMYISKVLNRKILDSRITNKEMLEAFKEEVIKEKEISDSDSNQSDVSDVETDFCISEEEKPELRFEGETDEMLSLWEKDLYYKNTNFSFNRLKYLYYTDKFEFYAQCKRSLNNGFYFELNISEVRLFIDFKNNDYDIFFHLIMPAINALKNQIPKVLKLIKKLKINNVDGFYIILSNDHNNKSEWAACYCNYGIEFNLSAFKHSKDRTLNYGITFFHEFGHLIYDQNREELQKILYAHKNKDFKFAFKKRKIGSIHDRKKPCKKSYNNYYDYFSPKRTFRRELRSNEYTAFSKTNIYHNYHEELFVELFAHNIKRYEKGYRKNSSTAYVLSDVYPNTNYAVECLLKNKRPNKFKSLKQR